MKWLKALGGLAVLGAFVYAVLVIRGQAPGPPVSLVPGLDSSLVPPPEVRLERGTPVELLLLTPLTSGGSKVGDEVKLVAAQDVTAPDGRVVVAQGAPARARVAQSRGATVVSVLANQPARLALEGLSVEAVDGQSLALGGPDGEVTFSLTQANTRPEGAAPDLGALATDPEAQAYLKGLAARALSGKAPTPQEERAGQEQLRRIAERHGMPSTEKMLGDPKKGTSDTAGVIERLQQGDVSGLTGVELVVAAQAAGEVLNLASTVDQSLRGIFKGPNVRANVGTVLKLEFAEAATVRSRAQRP